MGVRTKIYPEGLVSAVVETFKVTVKLKCLLSFRSNIKEALVAECICMHVISIWYSEARNKDLQSQVRCM